MFMGVGRHNWNQICSTYANTQSSEKFTIYRNVLVRLVSSGYDYVT